MLLYNVQYAVALIFRERNLFPCESSSPTKLIYPWIEWNCCSKIHAPCPLECIKVLIWHLTNHTNLDYVHSRELFLIQMWSNLVERVWTVVSSTDWCIHQNCDKKPHIGSPVKIPEFLPMRKIQNTYWMYILSNVLCVKHEIHVTWTKQQSHALEKNLTHLSEYT